MRVMSLGAWTLFAAAFCAVASCHIIADRSELKFNDQQGATGGSDGGNATGGTGKTADGKPCSNGTQCTSGSCADNVCCDSVCDGSCVACTAAKTGGFDGVCAFVVSGTDPDSECAPEVCDGAGECKLPAGETCGSAVLCASGSCIDGFCCDTSCDGNCESCAATWTGKANGVCAPVNANDDPHNDCSPAGCMGSEPLCCGDVAPAPGGVCPTECTGGCGMDGNTCIIDCTATEACKGRTLACPSGFACEVNCGADGDGNNACEDATIDCPPNHACNVNCEAGNKKCKNATINCSETGTCAVWCNGGDSCDGTMLNCGLNACGATCPSGGALPSVDCAPGPSCDCTECPP